MVFMNITLGGKKILQAKLQIGVCVSLQTGRTEEMKEVI